MSEVARVTAKKASVIGKEFFAPPSGADTAFIQKGATSHFHPRFGNTRLGSRVHWQAGCLPLRWRRASQRAGEGGIRAASFGGGVK
jgi:hypothetical protein